VSTSQTRTAKTQREPWWGLTDDLRVFESDEQANIAVRPDDHHGAG
jgi:hypothetical protein